ncbi:carboxypeptidase regulatory-like domain-containing protein [Microvirga sp. 0TCS3.31]
MLTGIRTTSHDRPTRRRGRLTAAVAGATLALGVAAPVPSASAAAPGAIAGTVNDADGPLAGVEVAVYDNTPYGDVLLDQVVTDASGDYQLDGIPADPYYKVRFTDPTGEHATEYYRDQVSGSFATWVPVAAGDVNTMIDATLEPGSTLSGRLTRAGGAPVAGGTVTLWWRYGAQAYVRVSDHVADADGRWAIPGVRGALVYGLVFGDPVTGASEAWGDAPEVIGSAPVAVPIGEDVTGLDARLGGVVANSAAPSISGTPQVGQTLTAAPGTWQPTDTTVTYRWIVGDDVSPGDDPRGATYVPTAQDLGKTIRVEATGTRGAGWTPATVLSAPTAPVAAAPVVVLRVVNDRLPRIKGTLRAGRTVRVTTGTWTPYPQKLRFRWYAGKKAIAGATHQRLRLTKKQAGKRLRVVVKASAPGHEPLTVATKRSDKVRR